MAFEIKLYLEVMKVPMNALKIKLVGEKTAVQKGVLD